MAVVKPASHWRGLASDCEGEDEVLSAQNRELPAAICLQERQQSNTVNFGQKTALEGCDSCLWMASMFREAEDAVGSSRNYGGGGERSVRGFRRFVAESQGTIKDVSAAKEAMKGGGKKEKVEGRGQAGDAGRREYFIAGAQSGEAPAGAGRVPPNPEGKAATLR
ncbi:uncharacterized protein BBA_08963 [Beauveria bassiana ARSEF 2860]|uniref:Uncharacterized protein n=1 Tax=Beauveria bassiana (strain ARSEF 2860) TaxID=655819 RepID=J4KLE0_BEAB2|nr:uncharacterized protein BBA_08963 [Beauveria bassiana ARSEF 2860]EJP62039.1 hypothetical protein BBA_08963 [Beauveria bassiana ARSEF 2860]